MFTLHKNQILMEYIFLLKQIVGFSKTTQIVGFANGDDSEDLFLTKTLTNMKCYQKLVSPTDTPYKSVYKKYDKLFSVVVLLCVCVCVSSMRRVFLSLST